MHRYVLLLFLQPNGKVNNMEQILGQNSMSGRSNQSTRNLIGKYSLKPIAGNFFLAEYDSFVPVIQMDTFEKSMK